MRCERTIEESTGFHFLRRIYVYFVIHRNYNRILFSSRVDEDVDRYLTFYLIFLVLSIVQKKSCYRIVVTVQKTVSSHDRVARNYIIHIITFKYLFIPTIIIKPGDDSLRKQNVYCGIRYIIRSVMSRAK